MQESEIEFKKQCELRNEVMAISRNKGLTYGQALNAIKDARSYLERASLENKF